MNRLAAVAAFALVLAGCGNAAGPTTTAGIPATQGTTTSAPPTTTAAETTTTAAATSTTVAATTTTAEPGPPAFAITQVVFGDNGYVAITNVGGGPGDLGGHWLCQRPLYFEIPSTPLEAGETVWVATGDGAALAGLEGPSVAAVVAGDRSFGDLNPGSGEMAIYMAASFDDSRQIVDYVEWGEAGHGRSSVAIEAGIWADGAFVAVPEEAVAISSTVPPVVGPDRWSPDIGV